MEGDAAVKLNETKTEAAVTYGQFPFNKVSVGLSHVVKANENMCVTCSHSETPKATSKNRAWLCTTLPSHLTLFIPTSSIWDYTVTISFICKLFTTSFIVRNWTTRNKNKKLGGTVKPVRKNLEETQATSKLSKKTNNIKVSFNKSIKIAIDFFKNFPNHTESKRIPNNPQWFNNVQSTWLRTKFAAQH